nr:putative transporter spbpb2b2.16c [Quercus suber]
MSPMRDSERTPLLQNGNHSHQYGGEETVEFSSDDPGNPQQWSLSVKYLQTLQVFLVGFVCPMASSILSPALDDIASTFNASKQAVLAGQTVFVAMLGIGPLFLAPMSETFGRRPIFLICLTLFTLVQIPTALAPNLATFLVFRTFSGFFGSVGVANGGGSIADMFPTHKRAPVLGVYLTAPLLAPTIGPFIASLLLSKVGWEWVFWFMAIVAGLLVIFFYFFCYETNAAVILQQRKTQLEKENPDVTYTIKGANDASVAQKIAKNSTKAVRILISQPVVLTMSTYQALTFATMYSLYSQFTTIFSSAPYNFSTIQVGLTYLGPAIGFMITAIFIVAYIDPLYNYLAKRNNTDGMPEYRLPLANLGAVLLPISIFWFGWAIDKKLDWPIPWAATIPFGASQVSIFNAVQQYYVDAYTANAASAIAAGAFLRSLVGAIVPLFVGNLMSDVGYGWGMSVFGFLSLLLMPAPLLFQRYGKTLREKFPFEG